MITHTNYSTKDALQFKWALPKDDNTHQLTKTKLHIVFVLAWFFDEYTPATVTAKVKL